MPRPARRGPSTLAGAFRALGAAPTRRELRLVRAALFAAGVDPCGVDFGELVAVAQAAGSSAFVALDLVSEPLGEDEDADEVSAA